MVGRHAHDAASVLPAQMLVGVSETTDLRVRRADSALRADGLVFQLPRQRGRGEGACPGERRVLELIDTATGSRIELEGNRIPLTHSKDVIHNLIG